MATAHEPGPVTGSLEIEKTQTPLQQKLAAIRDMEDPMSQYRELDIEFSHFPHAENMDDIHSLFSFAADPDASPSLLVRAQAFEVAHSFISGKFGELREQTDGSYDEIELMLLQEDIATIIPDAYSRKQRLIKNPANIIADDFPVTDFNPHKYRAMVSHLIEKEGLDKDWIYPDWHQINPDYFYGLDDPIPANALLFLESMADRIEQYDRGEAPLPLSRLSKLLPLAVDIQKKLSDKDDYIFASTDNAAAIVRDAEEIGKLYDAPGHEEYLTKISHLEQSSRTIASVFPEQYRDSAMRGAQAMFADCVYAVRAHLENGSSTHVVLPLNGSSENGLELNLEGDEPLLLIEHLNNALTTLGGLGINDSHKQVSSTKVTDTEGYSLYRLWRKDYENWGSAVSVYIRPRGAETYDQDIEYGRNGEGVEASISYVIDIDPERGEVAEVGKHRGRSKDNRISIRLDREGISPADRGSGKRRDPTRTDGTLSLDISSVIGNEEWLSTKIGRFLAWGNHLRAQALDSDTHLNHSIEYFSPEDGNSDNFAEAAEKLIEYFDGRKLSGKQLAARLSGGIAISRARKHK